MTRFTSSSAASSTDHLQGSDTGRCGAALVVLPFQRIISGDTCGGLWAVEVDADDVDAPVQRRRNAACFARSDSPIVRSSHR
jgi:hypothetical protein